MTFSSPSLMRALTPARLAIAVALVSIVCSVYQVLRAPPVLVATPSLAIGNAASTAGADAFQT